MKLIDPQSRQADLLLVVDDEEQVCVIMKQMLEGMGFCVLTCTDAAGAISTYHRHQAKIALVITDMLMPFMDGSALIQALLKINPWVLIIAMSGFPGQRARAEQVGGPDILWLPKPFTVKELEDRIHVFLPPRRQPKSV